MQDRSDSGQVGCRIGQLLDRMDAGQFGCKTGRIQDRSDSGQDKCRTGQMQDRTNAALKVSMGPLLAHSLTHYVRDYTVLLPSP